MDTGLHAPERRSRLVHLAALAALTACASTPTGRERRATEPMSLSVAAPATMPEPAAAPTPPTVLLGGGNYTRGKFGVFLPSGDLDALDDGIYGELAMGTGVLPFVSVDVSLGYLGADAGGSQQLRAVPLFVNARAELPILVFEVYGGIGVGGMFADYELGAADDSEFLTAATGFAGLEFGLGRLAVGGEYRYLTSDETDAGFTIEGHALLVTATLPF